VEKAFSAPGALGLLAAFREALAAEPGWDPAAAAGLLKQVASGAGAKPGAIMLPCRVALTGQLAGAGLGEIMDVLGRDRTLARLDRTLAEFQRGS
jgi:glutamyl-tRNA synthetase